MPNSIGTATIIQKVEKDKWEFYYISFFATEVMTD